MASFLSKLGATVKAAQGIFSDKLSDDVMRMLTGIAPVPGYAPPRTAKATLEAYGKLPWLRAVAANIAEGVAAVDWHLYVAKRGAEKATKARALQVAPAPLRHALIRRKQVEGELQEIETSPLLDLLDQANSYHTGLSVRKVTQIHLDLLGEAFWLKERNGVAAPVGVWPLPPHWVTGTPTPDHRFFRVSFSGWQGEIPDTEILWFCDLDPANPYGRGTGTAQALGDELDTDEYAAKFTRQFFVNSGRPDFMVYPKGPGGITEANAKRLETDWQAQHQGFWRAFRPHFLTREVGVFEFASQSDMRALQMVEIRKAERDTIIQVFRMSPESLGVVAGADRAHAEAAALLRARDVLVPRLEFQRAVLQEKLVPEYDERLILDYESPVQEDKEFRLKAMAAAPWASQVDEWREIQGWEPLEADQGKVFMVPIALQPTEELVPAIPPPPAPALPPSVPPPPGATLDADRYLLKGDAEIFKQAGDSKAEAYVLRQLDPSPDDLPTLSRIAERLEPRARRKFLAAIATAKGRVDEAALAEAIRAANMPAAEAATGLGDLDALFGGLGADLRTGFLAGAKVGYDELTGAGIALDFDLINPAAVRYARLEVGQRITVIAEETRDAIRDLIADSFTSGVDAYATARKIKALDGFGLNRPQMRASENFLANLQSQGLAQDAIDRRLARYNQAQLRYRSRLVARTEMLDASNAGQQALWEEAARAGAIRKDETRREWIAAIDDRLCEEICEPLDKTDAPLDGPFVHPTTGAEYMRPPAHPACRCSTGLKFTRESLGAQVGKAVGAVLAARKVTRRVVRDASGKATGVVEEG